MPMAFGEITYEYKPADWSQDKFLRLGGFTVIFLNYNKLSQIRDSVASALNQDFPLLEMFFMDDASTDGSGDVMEDLVRQYAGRHKVTVVRNTENQRITGQWNIVSKLATGNWFGMFCADDIAYPNRVSQMAERVRQYPSLLGLCSSGVERDYVSGKEGRHISSSHELKLFKGTDSARKQVSAATPICGATAFWNRSLFEDPLPPAPYDDELLRWIILLRGATIDAPVWLWDGSLETITYGVGTGTSAAALAKVDDEMPDWKRWVQNVKAGRRYHSMLEATWRGVLTYYIQHGASRELLHLAKGKVFDYSLSTQSSVARLMSAGKALAYPDQFSHWLRLTFTEMFGLAIPAVLCCFIHRLRGRSYRQIAQEVFNQ